MKSPEDKLIILLAGIDAVLLLFGVWQSIRADFYVGYFRQKQKNLGIKPEEALRAIFGRFWWLIK